MISINVSFVIKRFIYIIDKQSYNCFEYFQKYLMNYFDKNIKENKIIITEKVFMYK